MVNVTVTGTVLLLVKAPLISPDPLEAIPVTAALSLVQSKTVPATLPVNTMVVIFCFEQTAWLDGVAIASGAGFTVIVNCIGVPVQVTPLLYRSICSISSVQ